MSGRSGKRKGRLLSEEDRALWKRVTDSVAPMPGRKSAPDRHDFEVQLARLAGDTEARPREPIRQPPKAKTSNQHLRSTPAAQTAKPSTKAKAPKTVRQISAGTAPLDTKTTRRIAKGRDEIDARIDLHGLRQSEAKAALRGFLHRAHANGYRTVLVITGKGLKLGRPDADQPDDWWDADARERG
ncbi:MAG: Smr/MutS family protein, partial [Pseudomonadota bacterium]